MDIRRQAMPRQIGSSLVLAAMLALFLATAPNAWARPKPTVSWTSSTAAAAGAAIPVSWSSRHIGSAKLVVQRPVGTAKVWKTALTLRGRSGTAELPALNLGKYRYRLAALQGKTVVATQAVTVRVFGEVPFSTLLKNIPLRDGTGVYATPTASFTYVGTVLPSESAESSTTAFSVQHNPCTEVHVDFVMAREPGDATPFEGESSTVSIVQETRDPASTTSPFNQIGSVQTEVVPGQSWSVVASFQGRYSTEILFNGYAVCDSAKPLS